MKSFENQLELLCPGGGDGEPLSVLSEDEMIQVVGSLEQTAVVTGAPDPGQEEITAGPAG